MADKVRLLEMYTPRNLVLLTLSISEPIMSRGVWSACVFNKNVLGFVYIQRQIVVVVPAYQLFHLLSV